ncbi:MAG: hypothetical protein WBD55_07275, partial [Dehalococcoidia bacterium]
MRLAKASLAISLALVVAWFLSLSTASADPTHSGDGAVRYNRLPWLTGTTEVLTNGWGGCYGCYSHCSTNPIDRYATDWGPAGGGTFGIYVVSEGAATCDNLNDGFGFVVRVNRTNDALYDRYAHLPSCPFTGTFHYEQGEFISNAGQSGGAEGIHLHYQRESGTRASPVSETFCHSGLCNFCDHTIGGFCTGSYDNDNFVSDNAGPGVNAAGNLTAWSEIGTAYESKGHYLAALGGCSGASQGAWDCFGSSINFLGEGRMATRSCNGASNDCG